MAKKATDDFADMEIMPESPAQDLALFEEYENLIDVSAAVQQLNDLYPKVKMLDLVGRRLLIKGMTQFESRFPGQDHAYHMYCQDYDNHDQFRLVVGSKPVMDMLDMYWANGVKGGLIIRFELREGGKYGQYYVMT